MQMTRGIVDRLNRKALEVLRREFRSDPDFSELIISTLQGQFTSQSAMLKFSFVSQIDTSQTPAPVAPGGVDPASLGHARIGTPITYGGTPYVITKVMRKNYRAVDQNGKTWKLQFRGCRTN